MKKVDVKTLASSCLSLGLLLAAPSLSANLTTNNLLAGGGCGGGCGAKRPAPPAGSNSGNYRGYVSVVDDSEAMQQVNNGGSCAGRQAQTNGNGSSCANRNGNGHTNGNGSSCANRNGNDQMNSGSSCGGKSGCSSNGQSNNNGQISYYKRANLM